MEDIAKYAYDNGACGYSAALEFKEVLELNLEKIASAPLQNSSEWSNPQRRSFFDHKGQYTLLFVFSQPNAKTNGEVIKLVFTNIYPSRSKEGNSAHPDEITWDIDELL